jgi:hypothetical protein
VVNLPDNPARREYLGTVFVDMVDAGMELGCKGAGAILPLIPPYEGGMVMVQNDNSTCVLKCQEFIVKNNDGY